MYAEKPIGTNGLGAGSLTTRSAEFYGPQVRKFVTEGGPAAAVGTLEGKMIKSVGASPYFKGNFSSLFKAMRESGGVLLDAHFGDATPGIYTYFGMHPGAICWQDLREMRPDWNPIHALQEFPHGTRLINPQGERVKLEVDEKGIGLIPAEALDEQGNIRGDWKVINAKVFMYAKEGPKYTSGFSDEALENLTQVKNLEDGYAVIEELQANAQKEAEASQYEAEPERAAA